MALAPPRASAAALAADRPAAAGASSRAHHAQHAALKAKYFEPGGPRCLQQPGGGRFSPDAQSPAQQQQQQQPRRLPTPAHRALAARLAAVAARQQARAKQQQQRRGCHAASGEHLATDVGAVCAELGLPGDTARALAAAAQQGRVSGNPGILLSQLVRLLPLEAQLPDAPQHRQRQVRQQPPLEPHSQQQQPQQQQPQWRACSSSRLGGLLASLPALVNYDPTTLAGNWAHAQQLLGADAAAAALWRQPRLITCSPFRLASNLAKLQELLVLPSPRAAAAVAARQPLLLVLCSASSLEQRARQVAQLLHTVPHSTLERQLRRTPELLLMRPSTLAAKLQCLQLALTPAAAAGACAAGVAAGADQPSEALRPPQPPQQQQQQQQQQQHPQQQQQQQQARAKSQVLQAFKQHELRYRLAQLQQLAAQRQERGLSSAASCGACRSSDGRDGAASDGCAADAQRLVLKVPALLCLNPATLHAHLTELQLLLELQPDDPQLARIVRLQPGLLTQAPRTLANKLQQLQHLTGRSEQQAREMALRCPAVLTISAASAADKWRLLQAATRACPDWQAQLRAAAPVTVAMLLCYSRQRLQRLQFVVRDVQQQEQEQPGAAAPGPSLASIRWRTLVQASDAAFAARFPRFGLWQAQQQQHQQQEAQPAS